MIIIPRYYYLGTAEDTMRDPNALKLQQSMLGAYRYSPLDWGIKTPILLMYGANLDLLAARDVTKELTSYEAWQSEGNSKINKQYNYSGDPILSGTVHAARLLAFKELEKQGIIKLEELAFKVLEEQACATS